MRYLVLFLLAIISFNKASSQQLAPYKQYKVPPSVRLLLPDNTGWELKAKMQKGKQLMIVVFSPDCDHCKHETEELVKNIDKFKNIQIVMATPLDLNKMNAFIKHYQLNKYPNITVGRDNAYALPVYYDIKNLPFHAFYNANKQLISGFEGQMSVASILKVFGK